VVGEKVATPVLSRVTNCRRRTVIGDGEIRFAVAVEIGDGGVAGLGSGGEENRGLEGAVAVAEQQAHPARTDPSGDRTDGEDVLPAVSVKVCQDHRTREYGVVVYVTGAANVPVSVSK